MNERVKNFKALGIRESSMIPYLLKNTDVPVQRTIDPTLLLTSDDYDKIAADQEYDFPYLLLYTRRYNPKMEAYAERVAKEKNLKIVEISLRAVNAEKRHIMRYDAGVEEFLSLVKHSTFVVTNSFHGTIFSVQYHKPFVVFSREQCDTKIEELLSLLDLTDRMLVAGEESFKEDINYEEVHKNIATEKENSMQFLRNELELLDK